MRLGLTNASYQYLFGGDGEMFVDRTSGAYDWRGMAMPYFTQTAVTVREPPEVFHIRRAQELEVPVVHTNLSSWDETHVRDVKERLRASGQELIPAVGADFMRRGDELKAQIDAAVEEIHRYGTFGGVKICKTMLMPMIYNRFRSDPPLREQLDRIIDGLPPLVTAARENGMVLAFENHLDYRASEVVEIIEAIDSPHLQFLFDTGNPFSVCEDPVDAAEIAAPYTVLVHAKDVRVVPWTPASPGYFAAMFACPLGEGNVDLERIVEILAERAPNSDELTLSIEVSPIPPYYDEDLWIERGIDWLKERFGASLT
jgi:sugar phosphate isomerase/epimerase